MKDFMNQAMLSSVSQTTICNFISFPYLGERCSWSGKSLSLVFMDDESVPPSLEMTCQYLNKTVTTLSLL